MMNEKFLQFVWKNRLFSTEKMHTVQGEPLQVLSTGTWNTNSGPDFFNAKVKIGNTLWAGNIEIHQKTSDWLKHRHHIDEAFNNVILHVVLENDRHIELPNGQPLPVFILNIKKNVIDNYQQLIEENEWPACRKKLERVDPFYRAKTLETVLIERLSDKTESINKLYHNTNNNWNETFYQAITRNFGFKTNALPFEMLARSVPYAIVSKHKNNLFQLEALLFGQSGLLNEQLIGDEYFIKLREEYSFLRKKYNLNGLEPHIWKFLRLRPANFPTIRIAQLAALIHKNGLIFSEWTDKKTIKDLTGAFEVTASEYWDSHYRFNMESPVRKKKTGKESAANLLINTLVPFMFFYGKQNNKITFTDLSLQLLKTLPPEKNRIVTRWEKWGVTAKSAFESQALIQLSNKYCIPKKCIGCQIGNKLIAQ
jgi:hypothetical protein